MLTLMTFASASQFHVYLPWGQCPFSIVSWQCLKCESASRHFQPGEGPSRGLLSDCENRWMVCSSSAGTVPASPSYHSWSSGVWQCCLASRDLAHNYGSYSTHPPQHCSHTVIHTIFWVIATRKEGFIDKEYQTYFDQMLTALLNVHGQSFI